MACGALLFSAAFVLYLPALGSGWINLDDYQYVRTNPYVLRPSLARVGAFFSEWRVPSTVSGYYQPLTMLSLVIDRLMDGTSHEPRPAVYHATNALLHALSTVLVWRLLQRWTGSLAGATLAAALFAAHPMQVESVAWIAQRKTVLATALCLLTLLCYDRGVRRGRAGWSGVLPFAAALLSKPTAFGLPLFLLMLDVFPYRRLSRRTLIEKWPYFAVAALAGYVALISQAQTAGADLPGARFSRGQTALIVCHNIVFYLRSLLWPAGLCPQYPTPPVAQVHLTNAPFLLGVVGTAGLVVALAIFRRRAAAWVGVLGFFALMNPVVLGAVRFQDAIAGDRFVYLPLVALLLPVALLAAHAVQARPRETLGMASFALMLLAWLAVRQQAVWHDSLSYWDAVVARFPGDAVIRYHRGQAYLTRDDYRRAAEEFQRAVHLDPALGRGYLGLGEALIYLDRPADALPWLARGLELDARHPQGHFCMGLARSRTDDPAGAIESYRRALAEREVWPEAWFNLGNCLARLGKSAEALPAYARAVELEPEQADYRYSLAMACLEQGDVAGARRELGEASRLQPGRGVYWLGAALVAVHENDEPSAVKDLQLAVDLDPALRGVAQRDPRLQPVCEMLRPAASEPGARPAERRPSSAPGGAGRGSL
ncbi:MAG: tetratricopeptide repeat protein [Phycisphaerae bacterium]